MDIRKSLNTTPFWFFLLLYLVVFFSGQYLGPPITAFVYNFKSEDELNLLFGLMAIVGFPFLSILLILATLGLKAIRKKLGRNAVLGYMVLCVVLVPVVFYVVYILNYYGWPPT